MCSQHKSLISLIILLVVVSVCGVSQAAEESKVVEVEGLAYVENGNLAAAKEQAINDGLRRAVEQVVGTYVDSSTQVDKGQLIEDEILKNSRGYVKDYKILDKNLADKNYKVKLKVQVGSGSLVDDLEALKMNIKRHGNPRIMILISQIKEGHYVNLSPKVVSNELMEQFIDSGYRIIDEQQIKKVVNNEQRQSIVQGDYDLAAKLGTRVEADLVVIGDARASHVDLSNAYGDVGSKLESYSSNINAKVVNTTTAEVITTANADSNGAGANKEGAARKALSKAAGAVGRELIDDISNQLIKQQKTVNLKINNINSLGQLKELEEILPTVSGIANVYFRGYNDNLGNFDLELKQGAETLDVAAELEEKVPFNFAINTLSSSKLILSIK